MTMFQWLKAVCMAAGLVSALLAQAGVVVGGTRVVYDAGKKEASISVSNPDKSLPYLIQSWIDNERDSDTLRVPFIITPPLFRLDAGQENVLRIVRAGGNLPGDRESVFWLNIKSIPATDKNAINQLLISINTRIKLFYRPQNLAGRAGDAYKALNFSRQGGQLTARNPTPFYVSFASLSVSGQDITNPGMIAPLGTLSWPLPAGVRGNVMWRAINEFGGTSAPASAPL
ncbi:molecular chaperone [Sodalis sp. C49]|uniref:fimbrial biogenesis chaperone n=1 Tax=unclassified Sodalis (in: enterobacteria) TaxID=2636512 RepID=UPI003965C558